MSNKLRQADLQMLMDHLTQQISFSEVLCVKYKQLASDLWEKCDKENTASKSKFRELNQTKDRIRHHKLLIKKYATLQRKLKKMLRTKQKGKV